MSVSLNGGGRGSCCGSSKTWRREPQRAASAFAVYLGHRASRGGRRLTAAPRAVGRLSVKTLLQSELHIFTFLMVVKLVLGCQEQLLSPRQSSRTFSPQQRPLRVEYLPACTFHLKSQNVSALQEVEADLSTCDLCPGCCCCHSRAKTFFFFFLPT